MQLATYLPNFLPQNSFCHLHINFMVISRTKTSANEQNRMLMCHTFSCSNMHAVIIHVNCNTEHQSGGFINNSKPISLHYTLLIAITCTTHKHITFNTSARYTIIITHASNILFCAAVKTVLLFLISY